MSETVFAVSERSSIGWLLNPEFDITKNALIVTAVSSDSRRKLISVLRSAGRTVASIDVPPADASENAIRYYTEQLVTLARTIGRHTGKHLNGRRLRNAVKKIVVMGSLVLDITLQLRSEEIRPVEDIFVQGKVTELKNASFYMGGCVGNTGLALHKLGADVTLCGKVGRDFAGGAIRLLGPVQIVSER